MMPAVALPLIPAVLVLVWLSSSMSSPMSSPSGRVVFVADGRGVVGVAPFETVLVGKAADAVTLGAPAPLA